MARINRYNIIPIVYITSIFLLLQNDVLADENARALEAMSNQQYTEAVSIWTTLVAGGDVVVEYNLALALQKSAADASRVKGWLKAAARNGLVNAYSRFQPGAVKPGAHTRAIIIRAPDDWVREQDPRFYTLQLASSTNPRMIERYYLENQLEGKAGYYRYTRKNKIWYALVYGAYSSSKTAQQAIETLPVGLRKWSPWVRKYKDVHNIMQPLD